MIAAIMWRQDVGIAILVLVDYSLEAGRAALHMRSISSVLLHLYSTRWNAVSGSRLLVNKCRVHEKTLQ